MRIEAHRQPINQPATLEGLVEHLTLAQDEQARTARVDARRADAARFAAAERALSERARASRLQLAGELVGHGVQLATSLAELERGAGKAGAKDDPESSEGRARARLATSIGGIVQSGIGHAARSAEHAASESSLAADRHERLAADARDQAGRETAVRDQLLRAYESAASAAREGDRLAAGGR